MQTYIAKKIANHLSKELHTTIEIKSFYLEPFRSLVLEGVFMCDMQKDTLIYAKKCVVDLWPLPLLSRRIRLKKIQLEGAKFYLKEYQNSTNLDFLIQYFHTSNTKGMRKDGAVTVQVKRIILKDIAFKYRHNTSNNQVIHAINFSNVDLKKLYANLTDVRIQKNLFSFCLSGLTFKEKSGFFLRSLASHVEITSKRMEFKKLRLETPHTYISDYVLLTYNRWSDFSEFTKKVYLQTNFNYTKVSFSDIAYFAPEVYPISLTLSLQGSVTGYVNKLKAYGVLARFGKSAYLKGNFDMQGLPNVNKTFIGLNFSQLHSTKEDAEYLINALTGQKKYLLPNEIHHLGPINYKGKVYGLLKKFCVRGELNTNLGRIGANMNIGLGKEPLYLGTFHAYDFQIGSLINQPLLGRTTLMAYIDGKGLNQHQLTEKLTTQVDYIDFNGYRYKNVHFNGSLYKNSLDGQIKVRDQNLYLDLQGSVNFKDDHPQYNLSATVRQAKLQQLRLINDTTQVDADIAMQVQGKNLDDIQGNLFLNNIKINRGDTSTSIDTVQLFAQEVNHERYLKIHSDVLDADIEGKIDLYTLPSYFKSIVKKYSPSIQTTITSVGDQNFKLRAHLKNFAPLSFLIAPHLHIARGATLKGRFTSSNITDLSGSISWLKYKSMKVDHIALRKANSDTSLSFFLTARGISFHDSLYMKDILLANVLKNDSLTFNIRLSDQKHSNELNINALAEFNMDPENPVKLSMQPSELILNHEIWAIDQGAVFTFEKLGGKTSSFIDLFRQATIRNLTLSCRDQQLKINGSLSSFGKNKLMVEFVKFPLATINPFLRAFGMGVKGQVNGKMSASTLGNSTYYMSNFKVDSMLLNEVPLGELQLATQTGDSQSLTKVHAIIHKQGTNVLQLDGFYNTKHKYDNLNMELKMKDLKLAVLKPFIHDIIDSLSGGISADAKLTGTFEKLSINGHADLVNARATINYLKTTYRLTSPLAIENSIIKLRNLIIKDPYDHQAIANGTVDLRKFNNPHVRAKLTAENFLFLNTSAKDNPLYYGTATGTGTLSFLGPLNNMKINVAVQTGPGTVFNIPLNSPEIVNNASYITFVSKGLKTFSKRDSIFKGPSVKLLLDIDPNTTVNIYTDLVKLSGNGNAALTLDINNEGDFGIFGDYSLSRGDCDFRAKNLINKKFDIRPGSSIRWVGNPSEATVNINAAYAARTSITPLYMAAGRAPSDVRVLAEATMALTGSLLKPEIHFGLNFPSDSYINDELQGYLNDTSNLNQQALSLILKRSFTSGTNDEDITQQINTTATSALTEAFFNQINGILTESLNLNFVDFNIHSLNDASASLKLFNNRLIVTGGVSDKRTSITDLNIISSTLARDLQAQYLVSRDGHFMLQASNRLGNRDFLNQTEEYINALGLAYHKDFDKLGELFHLFSKRNSKPIKRNRLFKETIQSPLNNR